MSVGTRDFLFGIILSIIYTFLLLPSKTGQDPSIHFTLYPIIFKGMIYIPISKKKCIHLHHWIIFLSILCFYKLLSYLAIGFSLGIFLQGILTYTDAFNIIVPNPY